MTISWYDHMVETAVSANYYNYNVQPNPDENEEIDEMTDNLARNFRDAQKQLNQIKNRPFKSKIEERMALNLASRYASDISDLTQRFRFEKNKKLLWNLSG